MATIEQHVADHEKRISSIEADRRHLATKADLALLKSDLAQLENRLLWRILVPVMIGIVASIVVQVWAG